MFISNHYLNKNNNGYKLRDRNGDLNLKKFINSLDYSLDLIQLREIYESVYRRRDFSFTMNKKEYSKMVINVTFKYSIKQFNRIANNVYVKYGYNYKDIVLTDGVCVQNGELIAIQVDEAIEKPVFESVLGQYFTYMDGKYRVKNNPTLFSVADIREKLYEEGFVCEGIKFVRMSRSSGSSRVGKCLFVDERLFKRMNRWISCELKFDKKHTGDLAGWESYISLTSSSIIDTLEINPENILVIDDYESVFKEKAVATRFDGKNLSSKPEEVEVCNSIWDGQSLMDKSLFGQYEDKGMLLLRNRFFKSCCFNTNIQQWFEDNGITDINQLNGYTQAKNIKDIKLITTPSSIKYLKFGSLDDWLWTLNPIFGVVKYEKPTGHFDGRMVQSHYQLLNTVQLSYEETEELLKPSLEYLKQLKTNPSVLRYHIHFKEYDTLAPIPLTTKNDIVYKMLGLNDKFAQTALYYDFRNDLIKSFTKNLRKGHILIKGNYSTLFGNPLEMLKQVIGKFDGQSSFTGVVHSLNFEDGTELLGTRSPHVTMGNILITQNCINPDINKYFNLTKEIVCVNSINENLLERLSGADFDSDTMMLTDNRILIEGAKRNYDKFLVPTKLVKAVVQKRRFDAKGKAELDIKTSTNKIGEIINLSQELNSKLWDKLNKGADLEEVYELYCDIAQLDVMSNLEIDSAKRENPADNTKELKKLKKKYEERDEKGRYIRPLFFKYIDKEKGYYNSNRKKYKKYMTTMDYVQQIVSKYKLPQGNKKDCCSFISMLKPLDEIEGRINYDQVRRIIELARETKREIVSIWSTQGCYKSSASGDDTFMKREMSEEVLQACTDYVDKIRLNKKTMCYLLTRIEHKDCSGIRRMLFNILFGTPNKSFFEFLQYSKTPIGTLEEVQDGEIKLYDFKFTIT